MATRGTIEFFVSENFQNSENFKLLCTIYQHFDMYVSGLKEKLIAAINHQFNENKQLAVSFLAANTDSELTTSSESHGDLEYKYQIFEGHDKKTITVHMWSFEHKKWIEIVSKKELNSFLY